MVVLDYSIDSNGAAVLDYDTYTEAVDWEGGEIDMVGEGAVLTGTGSAERIDYGTDYTQLEFEGVDESGVIVYESWDLQTAVYVTGANYYSHYV